MKATVRRAHTLLRLVLISIVQPDALGIRRSPATKRIQREAFRAWMAGLLFNIMASVYTLSQIKAKASSLDRKSGESAVEKKKLERYVYK